MTRCRAPYRGTVRRTLGSLLVAASLCAPPSVPAADPPGWAVASAHPAATEAARWVAEQGGNAFDAAVAVTAALAVAEPMSSGLGGGGFWLLHRAGDGLQIMVDGRERAPLAADRDMYLGADGEVVPDASLDGPRAAAIPGEPAAMAHIARKFGRLDLTVTLEPAIALAERGFASGERLRRLAEFRRPAFNPRARQVFLRGGEAPPPGTLIVQPELAKTLRQLSEDGHPGFYSGWVASTLISEVVTAGGIWSQQDLSAYQVVEREPIVGRYRGVRVVSASPPSSGGIVLTEILNMLQADRTWQRDRFGRAHSLVEAMRRAYRDRALYLGDPDFVGIDVDKLTSVGYARERIADLAWSATPSVPPAPGEAAGQGRDTSHFSIIDDHGNRVAATLSVNYPFGSGFLSRGTGVVLNNEMDDFVSKPGVPNVYGLVGGDANAIAPGKRPLSSMSPTFVEADDFVAVLGTPGGSRIITMVLLALLDLVDGGERDLEKVVNLPRFHHQYLPDRITFEPGALDDGLAAALAARGHVLDERETGYGDMQAVLWRLDADTLSAASDGRGEGSARVWP